MIRIYEKMNKLTSLCYPEYYDDEHGSRMKPPMTKFRLGDMFGSRNKELMGFIKSLNYSVDQSSTWETEPTKRVPRHVIATIGYQIIHANVPNLETEFYGINQYPKTMKQPGIDMEGSLLDDPIEDPWS